jgi:hypothetical protein
VPDRLAKKSKSEAAAKSEREIDYRQLQLLLEQLKETAALKRGKAGEYQRKGRQCRAQHDEPGAKLQGAACVRLQDQALEIDKLYINLDNLFEILQSRKLTKDSLAQMRACLTLLNESAAATDLTAIDKFQDELANAIDLSREITEVVAGDHAGAGSVVSNRAIERALKADFDMIVDSDDEDEDEKDEVPASAKHAPWSPALGPRAAPAAESDRLVSGSEDDGYDPRPSRLRAKVVTDNPDGYDTVLL